MTAGGKGHARRPTDEAAYGSNYDAIFGRKADQALADAMRAENLAATQGPQDANNAGKSQMGASPA